MTKAEAKAMLKRIQEPEAWEPQINQAAFEALDMAIEALSCSEFPNSSDTIYRQAAIDAIHEDAEWLAAQGSDWQVERMERDKSILKSLPTVQPTQEIIHCKDCRFWKKYKYFNGKPTYAPFCGFNSIFTDDNDFCSMAEKRGEADDRF